MRLLAIIALAAFAFIGCGSNGNDGGRIERAAAKCTDAFLRTVRPGVQATKEEIRHYISVTYCDRFARNGWVYSDGALSIEAQRWLDRGGREGCATASPTGTSETIPCEQLPQETPRVIECAMLHHVRRSEVRRYLRAPERQGVRCDDGTPLSALGVPAV